MPVKEEALLAEPLTTSPAAFWNHGEIPADLMGPAAVKDLLFTGRLVGAVEAQTLGLVSRIVPAGQIGAAVERLAADIAANAPLTLRATKEMIRRVLAKRRLSHGEDADLVELCYTSADFREGVTSFLAKRKPHWTGR